MRSAFAATVLLQLQSCCWLEVSRASGVHGLPGFWTSTGRAARGRGQSCIWRLRSDPWPVPAEAIHRSHHPSADSVAEEQLLPLPLPTLGFPHPNTDPRDDLSGEAVSGQLVAYTARSVTRLLRTACLERACVRKSVSVTWTSCPGPRHDNRWSQS